MHEYGALEFRFGLVLYYSDVVGRADDSLTYSLHVTHIFSIFFMQLETMASSNLLLPTTCSGCTVRALETPLTPGHCHKTLQPTA